MITARRVALRPSAAWRALVMFHAGAGARSALRAGTIVVASLVFAVGSAPDPAYALMMCVRALVAPGAPGAALQARLLLGALALRPGLALLTPAAALALGALAVRRERRAAGAVRWDELRHDPAGDVGWIARV